VEILLILGLVLAAVLVAWAEALFGRYKLRRFLERRGYVLLKARWRGPFVSLRQAQFNITLERDKEVFRGRAYVGGMSTGPVFSSTVRFSFDEHTPDGGGRKRP
jgi:hypothetical protein